MVAAAAMTLVCSLSKSEDGIHAWPVCVVVVVVVVVVDEVSLGFMINVRGVGAKKECARRAVSIMMIIEASLLPHSSNHVMCLGKPYTYAGHASLPPLSPQAPLGGLLVPWWPWPSPFYFDDGR